MTFGDRLEKSLNKNVNNEKTKKSLVNKEVCMTH